MIRHSPVLIALWLLSACSLAPDYRPPELATPAAYKEVTPWQAAQPADALVRGPWWECFGDATLNGLETQIESGNPDLAAAAARYREAQAVAAQAAAGLAPQAVLAGDLSANRQSKERPLRGATQPNNYGANEVGAAAGYEFDFWGRIANQAVAGAATAEARAADLATMRLSLQAALADQYFTLRGLDRQAALLDDSATAYQKALDLTEMLFKGRIAPGIDVSRARTQLESVHAQRADIALRRAAAEHAVAVLVGKPASDFSLPVQRSAFALPAIPAGIPSALLQRRPDIAAAERRVAAANQLVGAAKAAFYPSLSLGLLGGFDSTRLSLLSLPDAIWSIGPGISLPLLDGGRLDAEEAASYARLNEAGANYRSVVLNAFREVEDNAARLHWLEQEGASLDQAADAARQTLDAATALYRQGIASYLEVVTAQQARLQSEQAQLDVQTRRLLADVGLIRALGGGWS